MTRALQITILFFCLFSVYAPISAQQYGYVQYNKASGAPFERASTVIQDSEGYIWVGSENGLYRFDGIHFDNYSLHTESQFINQLHARGDTLMFLNEMGIYQIQNLQALPEVSSLIEGSIEERADLPFYPNDFILGEDGEIWMSQSNHSIGRYHSSGFKTYTFASTEKAQKLALQKDSKGGVWALSQRDGLFLYNSMNDVFEKKLDVQNGESLLIYEEYMLVGSDAMRVYTLANDTPNFFKTIPMEGDLITAIHLDQDGHIIIGTRNGRLLNFTSLDAPPQTIYGANEAHRVEELEFGHIYEIYATKEAKSGKEKLWIAAETGLWLLQQRFFKTVENLPMNNPIAIAMGNEGQAWVPMNYLYEISPREEDYTARVIYDNLQSNAVVQDEAGFIWVSTVTPRVELLKFNKEQLLKRYDFHERGEAIFNLFADSKGNVWFCQAPVNKPIVGIAMINTSGEVKYYDDKKGFESRVLAIKESSRGEIYAAGIGEESYLYRYDPVEDRFVNLSPKLPFTALLNFEAHDLTIDDSGVVWLATTDGLLRYDSEKITLIQDDVLQQEEVRGVAHFANNNLWIATATKGLVFHHENISTVLGEQEGLPAVISAYRCINTDAEGRIWAGTAEGLVYSRIPAASLPYSNAPRVRKITVQGNEIMQDFEQVFKVRKNQDLQIEYSNLSFPARNVQYQYRLLAEEERDIMLEEQIWQAHDNSTVLVVSQEELGDYYLELRARQPGGYQWSDSLELRFNVFLPWYMQNWFVYGLIGLAILLLGYFFRSYVTRRFQRLQQVLKYSNEKLADKEAQLNKKIREFEIQKDELANANSNIQALELFIADMPKKASWDDIINAMSKAVNESQEVDAFEIAFKEREEIIHRGYSNKEPDGFTHRISAFNPKTSLTCWAMSNEQEVLINDFEKEHGSYIQEKEAYHFHSMLFIPFTLESDQEVVLCAYRVKKNDFDPNDLIMFRILAQFIHFSVHQKLTKVG